MRILYSVCFNVAIHHSINGKTGNGLDAQFSVMFLRWEITVVRLILSLSAISLLISPLVISINTSISRTDNSCSVFLCALLYLLLVFLPDVHIGAIDGCLLSKNLHLGRYSVWEHQIIEAGCHLLLIQLFLVYEVKRRKYVQNRFGQR